MRFHRPVALTTRPRVSVVIPCYNYGRYLPDAVASALDQDGVDVDVLIVDDASTDDSTEVALRLAEADARVDVLLHETNRGHIQTYNDGLAKVTGDYVVLLSADDLLAPNALTRAVALMERFPPVGLVYGYAATFSDVPPASARRDVESWIVWDGPNWLRRMARRGRNTIVNPEAVMRRSLLDDLGGGYDIAHPHAGDLLLWLRAAARAQIGRVNGPVQACYRLHDANMHSTRFAGAITDLAESRRGFEAAFDDVPDRSLRHRLRADMRRAVAREAMLLAALAQAEGSGEVAALASFAADCDPRSARSPRARALHRRERRGVSAPERRLLLATHSVRWRVRTTRWRRWGL